MLNRVALEAEYDRLYDKGNEILRQYDPCQIRREEDGTVSCLDTRQKYPGAGSRDRKTLCCTGCKHLGPEGCTVKALCCKTWLCHNASKAAPQAFIELNQLRRDALARGIPVGTYRTSKEDAFAEPKRHMTAWP